MVIISSLFLFFDPLLLIVASFPDRNRTTNILGCIWGYKMATVSSVRLIIALSEALKEQFRVIVYL